MTLLLLRSRVVFHMSRWPAPGHSFRTSGSSSSCSKQLPGRNLCYLCQQTYLPVTSWSCPASSPFKRTISTTPCIWNKVVPFNLSDIGEGIGEVVIKEWFVTPGQQVAQFDPLCEVQSDKASVTITSRFDGVIRRLYHEVDGTAIVGKPLLDIELLQDEEDDRTSLVDEINDQDAAPPDTTSHLFHSHYSNEGRRTAAANLDSYKKNLATPAVRRLAMENKIDLKQVKGSGRDGRVLKEDVMKLLVEGERVTYHPTSHQEIIPPPPPPVFVRASTGQLSTKFTETDTQRVPLTPVQRAMFRSMTESLKIPHLALSDDVDVSCLMQLKKSLFPSFARETGLSLTLLPFFIKAASLALEQFPLLNSVIDVKEGGDPSLLLRSNHNIGFAMDTSTGLMVPNVKDVQKKSIVDIATDLKRIQEENKIKGSLSPNDLSGGTFTLSNIGSIGGTFGVPVILPPQVVIGAIGRVRSVPKFDSEDKVVKADVLTVVWSADHRVVDGATITRFNNRWKSLLQEPTLMLLYLK